MKKEKKARVGVLLSEELYHAAYERALLRMPGVLDHGLVGKYLLQLLRTDIVEGSNKQLIYANGTDKELLEIQRERSIRTSYLSDNIIPFPSEAEEIEQDEELG